MQILNWNTLSPLKKTQALTRPAQQDSLSIQQSVAEILATVQAQGDQAVIDYTARFDGVRLSQLKVPEAELDRALNDLEPSVKSAMERAIKRIKAFHQAQQTNDISVETDPGISCERITRPIQRVGLYVPAGTAPLPSTVFMLAVPAAIAACPVRVLCTPPNQQGQADPYVLAAAKLCQIDQVFVVGGAQAIAAMAYGTESLPKVDKLFGPGNAWVTEAKQQSAQDPKGAALDMPAGPSEVMVIADHTARPEFAAADLLSQAEHGIDSQAILVALNTEIAENIAQETHDQLEALPRSEIARQAIEHSRIIVVDSYDQAIEVANLYASEHLIIQTENPRSLLSGIQAAGSIFLGHHTPEALGDYCSGTNHVLPTYGYAKNYSGLSLDAFLNKITVQEATPSGIETIGPDAMILAGIEGLDAHLRAVAIRLRDKQ